MVVGLWREKEDKKKEKGEGEREGRNGETIEKNKCKCLRKEGG